MLKMNVDCFSAVFSLIIFIFFPLMATQFYTSGTRMTSFLKKMGFYLNLVFSLQEKSPSLKSNTIILSILFLVLLYLNLSGLIPLSFSITTQLMLTLFLAISFWSSIFISNMTFFFKNFIGLFVPTGVTFVLSPLLSLIELISHLSRPFTLAIRLTANMTAGHVMLALMMTSGFSMTLSMSYGAIFVLVIWFFYLLVEFAISFIQSGIFSILNSVYLAEHL